MVRTCVFSCRNRYTSSHQTEGYCIVISSESLSITCQINFLHGSCHKVSEKAKCLILGATLIITFLVICSNYGSGYDTLGQQGSKDFNSYSSNGQSKSSGGSAGAGSGKGEVPLCTYLINS